MKISYKGIRRIVAALFILPLVLMGFALFHRAYIEYHLSRDSVLFLLISLLVLCVALMIAGNVVYWRFWRCGSCGVELMAQLGVDKPKGVDFAGALLLGRIYRVIPQRCHACNKWIGKWAVEPKQTTKRRKP